MTSEGELPASFLHPGETTGLIDIDDAGACRQLPGDSLADWTPDYKWPLGLKFIGGPCIIRITEKFMLPNGKNATRNISVDFENLAPTSCMPGTSGKVDILRKRNEMGLPLHHPKDARADIRSQLEFWRLSGECFFGDTAVQGESK